MKELMPLENVNAVDLFTKNGLDELLNEIDKEARSLVPDITTDKGRKSIASMAAKVAKSKTYLDGLGKELVSDWKKQAKVVDNERKKMRDTLDALKADVRKPLTDYENAEKERVEKHEERISAISDMGIYATEHFMDEHFLSNTKDYLKDLEDLNTDEFEEYSERAAEVKEAAMSRISKAIEKREQHDAEQAELAKLRAEKAENERKERDERIRREAAEKAKEEAENKAKQEREAAEKAANAEKEKAERERLQAIKDKEDAERRAEQAAQAERDKIEQEAKAKKAAEEARERDKTHRAAVNNKALDALVANGVSKSAAKTAITVIAKGLIPGVKISY